MADELAVPTTKKPTPLQTLMGSAMRITSEMFQQRYTLKPTNTSWQEDAWDMFDLVGEQRFLATTLAGRLSQARFFVGKLTPGATQPVELEPDSEEYHLNALLESIGDGPTSQAQLINRLGINLFVVGEGWLVGLPKDTSIEYDSVEELDLNELTWRMLSVSEVEFDRSQEKLKLSLEAGEALTIGPEKLYLIRVWRPHPRRYWEPDSPTRSSLPVLRELVGLTMHISAQVDSRLAGAGLLLVPQSAQQAIRIQAGASEDDPDPFTESLIQAMLTPIADRANASALVPLVLGVPDESTKQFEFITFSKPLDTEARSLRDEAIRRLALGQDAPPELLLGVSSMNHWGAWLVREDVVTTHIEPSLALICDALTSQFLWPVLEANGYTEEQAREYVIWYDVSHMIMRPNRAADALKLHEKGVLSDDALRAATGFDDSHAPESPLDKLPMARALALQMVRDKPDLILNPGLEVLIDQLNSLLNVDPVSDEAISQIEDSQADGDAEGGIIPSTDDAEMPEDDG